MNRASCPRINARIGADRRGGGLDGCRTALGMLVARCPPAIQFLLFRAKELRALNKIHQLGRLGEHSRAARGALTLPAKENPMCFNGLGLWGSSCGTSQRPATSRPARHR